MNWRTAAMPSSATSTAGRSASSCYAIRSVVKVSTGTLHMYGGHLEGIVLSEGCHISGCCLSLRRLRHGSVSGMVERRRGRRGRRWTADSPLLHMQEDDGWGCMVLRGGRLHVLQECLGTPHVRAGRARVWSRQKGRGCEPRPGSANERRRGGSELFAARASDLGPCRRDRERPDSHPRFSLSIARPSGDAVDALSPRRPPVCAASRCRVFCGKWTTMPTVLAELAAPPAASAARRQAS
ncbi:hypothetical protein BS50DRAFT_349953 [Corynespora cassiicola Philippines]|uniref:Uncharacterized protein n=1 Tax=Corynespora cassiicola Philippines TaxID=1448308 RepID=A0A2T2NQW1_CORCC|nr:hypothetical protein BS50DRAFT_349953 [Corynespora cassiicola Philippines]